MGATQEIFMLTTMLELAISMAFFYLMFSSICSAVQELIANAFRWRAKTLESGLGRLLQDPELVKRLYEHPVIMQCNEIGNLHTLWRSGCAEIALVEILQTASIIVRLTSETTGSVQAVVDGGCAKRNAFLWKLVSGVCVSGSSD
jgi:hypothetical protein